MLSSPLVKPAVPGLRAAWCGPWLEQQCRELVGRPGTMSYSPPGTLGHPPSSLFTPHN